MNFWLAFVDVIRFALFAAAHVVGGSTGAGILAFALGLRIAALPLTLPAARKMREKQAKLRQLKPELDRIAKQFKNDPRRLLEARSTLLRENGADGNPSLSTALVQAPIGAAVFASLRHGVARNTRFLWIRDLTHPDFGLALIAAAIAATAARLSGTDNQRVAAAIAATITFFFAWRMSAAIGLYSIAWSGVSAAESLVLTIADRRKNA